MRCACLVWLLAGCGFSSRPVAGADPGGEVDAPVGDPAGPVASACDVVDPSLRLCLTFEQDPIVDLVQPPHALAELAGVSSVVGVASGTLATSGGTAARLGSGTRIRFAESADFDVADLTIELWIDPSRIAKGQSFWLVDNNTQYFASYEDDGKLRCGIASQTVKSAVAIDGGWHHVACRYEVASHELRIYVDGDLSGCGQVAAGIPTTGNDGVAVGANFGTTYQDHFLGSMDGLHLYSRALADSEICRAAGRRTCSARCPG